MNPKTTITDMKKNTRLLFRMAASTMFLFFAMTACYCWSLQETCALLYSF